MWLVFSFFFVFPFFPLFFRFFPCLWFILLNKIMLPLKKSYLWSNCMWSVHQATLVCLLECRHVLKEIHLRRFRVHSSFSGNACARNLGIFICLLLMLWLLLLLLLVAASWLSHLLSNGLSRPHKSSSLMGGNAFASRLCLQRRLFIYSLVNVMLRPWYICSSFFFFFSLC